MPFNLIRFVPYLGLFLAVFGLVFGIYTLGSNHGKSVVQAKWDHQKQVDAEFVAKEKAKIQIKELAHSQNDRKISDELSDIKEIAAADKARIAGELALSLRDSAQRKTLYRAASEGSAIERERLASHAAELDRYLTEGVSLVEELQSTIEVRDGQLKALGAQILNDRQLINGSGDTDGQFEPAR